MNVGKLKNKGEEFDYAKAIDQNPEIEFWIRNLERRGYSLPISTENFYSDFIAILKDGRFLIIEYKGEYIATMESEKEKDEIGKLFERKRNGTALFLMAVRKDESSLDVAGQISKKNQFIIKCGKNTTIFLKRKFTRRKNYSFLNLVNKSIVYLDSSLSTN